MSTSTKGIEATHMHWSSPLDQVLSWVPGIQKRKDTVCALEALTVIRDGYTTKMPEYQPQGCPPAPVHLTSSPSGSCTHLPAHLALPSQMPPQAPQLLLGPQS